MSNLKVGTITHTSDSDSYVVTVTNKPGVGAGNYLDIGVGTKEDHKSSIMVDNDGNVTINAEIKCTGITGYANSAYYDKLGREIVTYYVDYDIFYDGLNKLLSTLKEETDPEPPPYIPS